MKNSNKFALMLTSFLVVISLVLTIGTSYSLWTYNEVQQSTNVVKSGCFSLQLEESNAINLSNTYPMSDEKGAKLTPYTLKIKNTCTIDANYTAILNVLTDTTLDDQYVKYQVTGNGVEKEPALINSLGTVTLDSGDIDYQAKRSYALFNGALAAGANVEYKINLWVSDTAGNEQMSKTFKAKMLVKSYATKIALPQAINLELTNLNSGLEEFNHVNTDQLKAVKAYRYVGSNPLNYVTFNNELWRIIGIFDVDSNDEAHTIEPRIKIIKNEPLAAQIWSDNNSYANSKIHSYLNNEYYNSLTTEAQNQVAPTIIYTAQGEKYDLLSANQLYLNERSYVAKKELNTNNNVSLLYASDYAYASGSECSDINILNSSVCKSNWLNNQVYWTNYLIDNNAYFVNNDQLSSDSISISKSIKPTVYLKSNFKLECDSTKGICGSQTNPYTLKGE